MSESYIVTIEEPMQIPATVYEAEERGQDEPVTILLDHQEEPNVIRGYTQQRNGGIRRPDGGLSWYHNNTACYMRAEPISATESKNADTAQRAWGDELQDLLETVGYPDGEYYNADLYLRESPAGDRKQVVGTSAYNTDDVRIERACWYEEHPRDDAFEQLLEQDGIDPDTFYDSIAVPDTSILDHLTDVYAPEQVSAAAFISAENMEKAEQLQQQETGDVKGSCVMGPTYS